MPKNVTQSIKTLKTQSKKMSQFTKLSIGAIAISSLAACSTTSGKYDSTGTSAVDRMYQHYAEQTVQSFNRLNNLETTDMPIANRPLVEQAVAETITAVADESVVDALQSSKKIQASKIPLLIGLTETKIEPTLTLVKILDKDESVHNHPADSDKEFYNKLAVDAAQVPLSSNYSDTQTSMQYIAPNNSSSELENLINLQKYEDYYFGTRAVAEPKKMKRVKSKGKYVTVYKYKKVTKNGKTKHIKVKSKKWIPAKKSQHVPAKQYAQKHILTTNSVAPITPISASPESINTQVATGGLEYTLHDQTINIPVKSMDDKIRVGLVDGEKLSKKAFGKAMVYLDEADKEGLCSALNTTSSNNVPDLKNPLTFKTYTGDIEDFVTSIAEAIGYRYDKPIGLKVTPIILTYKAKCKAAGSVLQDLAVLSGEGADIQIDVGNRLLRVTYPVGNKQYTDK